MTREEMRQWLRQKAKCALPDCGGMLPEYEITFRSERFCSIECAEAAPGLFTEGFPPIDAGNPVIEMFCDRGYVKIRCSESIYERELRVPDLSGSEGDEK